MSLKALSTIFTLHLERLNSGIRGVIIYNTVKAVSVREMEDLDRRAIEEKGIASIVLMENAGRGVAEVAVEMLGEGLRKRIAIFCGTGNNGGDGFVAARYLREKGIDTKVYIVGDEGRIKGDALVNLDRLSPSPLPSPLWGEGERVRGEVDLIIDAIFGIGLKGDVKEPARSIIANLNKEGRPILSVDVPSGLDADTGEVLGEAVKATKTVTMQFAKKGFYVNKGPEHVGELAIVDIGI